jgi:acetolactate decarboxylase
MQADKIEGSLAMLPSLWHCLSPEAGHKDAEMYQSSLMSALLGGVFDGTMTYGELHKHGDFGIGTFNQLDGEMVGLDGHFYQLRSDGSAHSVTSDQKTPFAVVTFFRPEKELHISETMTKAQLLALLETATEPNLFSAIKIAGTFREIRTRTVERQVKPYPRLTEATAHETTHTFSDVSGTLSGFRTPAYAQGLGVAGFHLHFLRDDRLAGGHALDYKVNDVVVEVATLHSFHVELPATTSFRDAALSGGAEDQEIRSSEG